MEGSNVLDYMNLFSTSFSTFFSLLLFTLLCFVSLIPGVLGPWSFLACLFVFLCDYAIIWEIGDLE